MSFGEIIRELRKSKGLSLRDAEKISGISHTYLSTLEKGFDPRTKKIRKPTPQIIAKLATGLNEDYFDLMVLAGYLEEKKPFNEEFKTDNISSEFGKALHKIRNDKNLSIRELAKRSGTSHPYLSQLETRKNKKPTPEILRKLAKGLKISYVSLLIEAEYLEKEDVKEYIQELL